jgi:DNA repair protein RecO
MPLIETPAIILNTLKLGDADKLITAYTLKRGRLKGVAVGARRMKSRFGAALEPFTHCNLATAEKGGERLARISQADIVHPFQKLREDWEGLSLGVRMLRTVERVTPEGDPNPGIFQLLCDGLHALEKGLKNGSDHEDQILVFLRFLKKVEGDRVYRLKPSGLIRKEVSLLLGRHLAHIAGRRDEF